MPGHHVGLDHLLGLPLSPRLHHRGLRAELRRGLHHLLVLLLAHLLLLLVVIVMIVAVIPVIMFDLLLGGVALGVAVVLALSTSVVRKLD